MTLPGFNAETSLYSSILTYFGGPAAETTHIEAFLRPAADSCVCTSPNCRWSCPTAPDCTTTGCPPGRVCCDCISPPLCTTPARCKFLCSL